MKFTNQNQTQTVSPALAMQMLGIGADKKPLRSTTAWDRQNVNEKGKVLVNQPEFARFKAHINFKNPKNPGDLKSYSRYWSWDYDNKTGLTNESQALQDLWNEITVNKQGKWNWATIYMNLTNNLRTDARLFNHTFAHLINGEQVARQGIKFLPFPSHIEGVNNVKVDIDWTVNNVDYTNKHIRR